MATEIKANKRINKEQNLPNNLENLDLIRSAAAPTSTDDEFRTLLYLSKEYNLDPLKKEIYFIKYGGKSTIITSRDGYLKIANLHDKFDGLESDVVYQGDKLTKRDDGSLLIEYGEHHFSFDKSKLSGAFCNVFRKDRSKAITIFVSIKDYYKKGAPIWDQYINAMILKVAESMALKRAFVISGLVTREEIEKEEFDVHNIQNIQNIQSSQSAQIIDSNTEHNSYNNSSINSSNNISNSSNLNILNLPNNPDDITESQKKAIAAIINVKQISEDTLKSSLEKITDKSRVKDLSKEEASLLITALNTI